VGISYRQIHRALLQYTCKRALYISQRALCISKRAPQILTAIAQLNCNTVFRTASHTLHRIATPCNALQWYNRTIGLSIGFLLCDYNCKTLQHTATHCNTLQHTHCTTLQRTAIVKIGLLVWLLVLSFEITTATHGNTLQHTATHTLNHPATHCNDTSGLLVRLLLLSFEITTDYGVAWICRALLRIYIALLWICRFVKLFGGYRITSDCGVAGRICRTFWRMFKITYVYIYSCVYSIAEHFRRFLKLCM